MTHWNIHVGDCRDVLASLPTESVHTCVTSPPYFGLRDYGTTGQIGLEPTPDEFVAALVGVFRGVRRVLRDDGTVWLNLGDSYAGSWGAQSRGGPPSESSTLQGNGHVGGGPKIHGLSGVQIKAHPKGTRTGSIPPGAEYKPKDLLGIPWMVAFALRADGWVLRSECIWSKPNPMPESVTDRPTKAHEQLFLFSKARWTGAEEPLPMRDVDAAWLAALVDGEGSICFQDRTSDRADQATYSVRLSIVNTNRALLERVEQLCGLAGVGSPSPRTRSGGESGRPVYAWQVTNAKAARVIAAIRPWLIAKATQADLALFVQALNRKHTGRGGHTVSGANQEAKRRAAAACSALNRGHDVDLAWFRPVQPGRWVPLPYAYDADAIREDSIRAGDIPGGDNSRGVGEFGVAPHAPFNGPVPSHRNKRSVWTVATQPYAGAHFATFPPKLIEPCVLAGAPERACGECGAPWVRVVEKTYLSPLIGTGTEDGRLEQGRNRNVKRMGDGVDVKTLGFEPSCSHGDGSAAGVVLDPFAGAGTTGVVALRHNRSFVGIELSPAYAAMARWRILDDAPLLNHAAELTA